MEKDPVDAFFDFAKKQPKGTKLEIDKIANVLTVTLAGESFEFTEQELMASRRTFPKNLTFDPKMKPYLEK